MDNVIALTCELLAQPSITPDDADCQNILRKRLEAIGFKCESMRFGKVDNLWTVHGDKAKLCYIGHTDVVPPGDLTLWHSAPFAPEIRDGKLFGRGVADMKGSVAAMVVALEDIASSHGTHALNGMSLLITSDEEGPAIEGTQAVLKQLAAAKQLPECCLVGEPSCLSQLGDTIKVGRRGSLHGSLKIIGLQGHVAYPERCINPIHLAAKVIHEISETIWDKGHPDFEATHIQFTQCHSGVGALNVVPPALSCQFNLRFAPVNTPEQISAQLEGILKAQNVQYELSWEIGALPFYTPISHPLYQCLQNAITAVTTVIPTHSTTGGTSDGRFFAAYGIPVFEFGPLNQTIHQNNEHLDVKDLIQLKEIYAQTVRMFLQR